MHTTNTPTPHVHERDERTTNSPSTWSMPTPQRHSHTHTITNGVGAKIAVSSRCAPRRKRSAHQPYTCATHQERARFFLSYNLVGSANQSPTTTTTSVKPHPLACLPASPCRMLPSSPPSPSVRTWPYLETSPGCPAAAAPPGAFPKTAKEKQQRAQRKRHTL